MTQRAELDYDDVQGLVRFGFGRMKNARYDLLRVKDPVAARSWLRTATVASAKTMDPPPRTALQIAFTAPGLEAIGIAASVIEQFSHEFRTGMTAEHRSRQLGDVGVNAVENWEWGGPDWEPHLLAMFFGDDEHFDDFVRTSKDGPWHEAFEVRTLEVPRLTPEEPFGFADGISQPRIDWKQERTTPTVQLDYTNITALGEFLLGYPNEYGKITDRPLLDPLTGTAGLLPAQDAPEKKDLARNGTYLVMRQLQQDVRGFWRFLDKQAGDLASAEKLAEAMVGRKRDGSPLVDTSQENIPGGGPKKNRFTFDSDPSGTRCPFGAHIRRANPRNIDYPERPTSLLKKLIIALGFGPKKFRYDLMSSVRLHRILRRGRGYGTQLAPAEALKEAPADEGPRGLHFVCLNANISRQFEFLQNAWMASTKFSGLTGESDPLIGNREPIPGCPVTNSFNIPQEGGLRKQVSELPQFVSVRGGAYFFLPSRRALGYFAGETGD